MRLEEIPTPAYVLDEKKLKKNLAMLAEIREQSGAKILLAQKAFSMYSVYPLIKNYLDGTTASGLFEARLGYEEMGGEVHVYSPAYTKEEIKALLPICDHITFNSLAQYDRYRDLIGNGVDVGLRLNPEHSTQETPIYDPCAPYSRLGITRGNLERELYSGRNLDGITGYHIHTLCEQDSDALEETVIAAEERFGDLFRKPQTRWLNLGGGHHLTKETYDRERLIKLIKRLKETYDVEIYLEPGEAVAYYAGYLVTEVMDIVENRMQILILDTSAACHMPDVLEMPYRPPLRGSGQPKFYPHTYRLAGRTCLAGDVIGDYSFEKPVSIGDRLVFEDMAIYSMVKNNTFNGMPLPSIYRLDEEGNAELVKEFGYWDFKGRLS